MGQITNYKNKASAKIKQAHGALEQKRGGMAGAKGGLRRMEGKVQEVMADANIALEKNKQKSDAMNRNQINRNRA